MALIDAANVEKLAAVYDRRSRIVKRFFSWEWPSDPAVVAHVS
jgi:hypothetical protein